MSECGSVCVQEREEDRNERRAGRYSAVPCCLFGIGITYKRHERLSDADWG